MKTYLTLFCSLLIAASAFAQAPEKMTFQSVVRNAEGQLVKSKTIGVKITVLQGSSNGTVVYAETFSSPTNANGLLTLEIGVGTPISGDFGAIDWSAGPYFIQTEADPDGGASYSVSGVSELQSVPYALHSKYAENIAGGENDPIFSSSIASGITAADTAHWNTHAIDTQIDSTGIAGFGYVAGPHTIDTDDQTLSLSGTTLTISEGNSVNLSSIDTDTQIDSAGIAAFGFVAGVSSQSLSLTGTMLEISGGNTVNLASIDTDTDDQTLSLSGSTLSIADGNSVSLSAINTDTQNLSLSGANLSISGGNSIDLSSLAGTDTDDQTLSLSGTTLSIADGNSVNLASIDTDTDDQTLSLSGSTLSIADGNSVSLSSINTDTQNLSLSGANLSISGGNSIDLSSLAGTDTDDQTLSISGTTLSIADGNSVSLSAINTDTQNLSLSGSNLSISGGNSVDLSTLAGTDTDDQTLSLSGSTLSIADGNSVNLPAVVAGSNKQITFNDNDSVGADAELVYDKTTNQMGIGTSTVNSGAALEVSSTTGGILLPRLTTAQRNALTPKVGTMVFNADSGRFQGYAGYDPGINAQYEDGSYLGNLSVAGQSFTATATDVWTTLLINFTYAVTGGTLHIYAGNGVGGSPIHTQSFTVGSGQQEITLTTPIAITNGQQYTFHTGEVCAYYPFGTYGGGNSWTDIYSFSGDLWFKIITGSAAWVDLH